MSGAQKPKREKLKRCLMQVNYRTAAGYDVLGGQVEYGTQSRPGGPVEVFITETQEHVCFTARECGLPVSV